MRRPAAHAGYPRLVRGKRWGVAPLVVVAVVAACTAAGPSPERDETEREQQTRGCVARILAGKQGPGCRTTRVRFPDRQFVPQGLALVGDGTAYLTGYHYHPEPGHRECQVARVDLGSGKVLDWNGMLWGDVPGVGRQFCRHGGGVALTAHGLWVAGAERLWLLDTDALSGEPVRRVWVVDETIRASTVAADDDELVIGVFREHRRGWALRFRYDELLAPGAARLDAQPGGAGVEPSRRRRTKSHVQGLALGEHGTWLARSTSFCGELVTPRGRRLRFLPGAEGLGFDPAGRIVVVSESGSRPYQRMGGRPDVPTLAVIEPSRLDRSQDGSCW